MDTSLRSIFTKPDVGLNAAATDFGLVRPISVRALAAHQAIDHAYQSAGGFKGQLGVATSALLPSDAGSFLQSFRGGDLRFSGAPIPDLEHGFQLLVEFSGIHCFGNPGTFKNDDAYLIVTIFRPEQAVVKTKKMPNDGTDDVWNNLEAGQDSTKGQVTIDPADLYPPQPIAISGKVMRCGALGCNTGSTRQAVDAAAAAAAGAAGAALTGIAAIATAAAAFGAAVANALSNLVGLDDTEINTWTKTFVDLNEIIQLPPVNSKKIGAISYNFESDLISDGDSSYKL